MKTPLKKYMWATFLPITFFFPVHFLSVKCSLFSHLFAFTINDFREYKPFFPFTFCRFWYIFRLYIGRFQRLIVALSYYYYVEWNQFQISKAIIMEILVKIPDLSTKSVSVRVIFCRMWRKESNTRMRNVTAMRH